MKTTAKEVAALAGVSVSAVSRAFRPGASISEDKRGRILAAADELGYRTPSGQVISELATGTIAVVMGDVANPFYPTVLEALSQELFRRGRRLILHVAPKGQDVDAVMRQVLDYRADGAIITSTLLSSQLASACRTRRMPVVLFNRTQPGSGISAVCCDNYAGGQDIGRRLVERGCRRIAFIGGLADTSTHLERRRGFYKVLSEAGLGVVHERSGAFCYPTAYSAALDLLGERPRPDAIFCANDVMALAAIDAAKSLGLRAPDDLAIVGFDDIPMAAWQSYRLTTVRQRMRQMIADALDLIEQAIEDPAIEGAIRMAPGKLIVRDTG
ncbi:MAG: substrate-binding domain-containing protein [Pseudomonadota bacterium]